MNPGHTGGPVASVAVFAYTEDGRCAATLPEGGLTLLDQFAIAALDAMLKRAVSERLPIQRCTDAAYEVAACMLQSRARHIEKGAN